MKRTTRNMVSVYPQGSWVVETHITLEMTWAEQHCITRQRTFGQDTHGGPLIRLTEVVKPGVTSVNTSRE